MPQRCSFASSTLSSRSTFNLVESLGIIKLFDINLFIVFEPINIVCTTTTCPMDYPSNIPFHMCLLD